MSADHLIGIEKFEAHLWKIADNLRANSNLASNEYFHAHHGPDLPASRHQPLLRSTGRDRGG